MSLHARVTPEAEARLRALRRRSSWSSVLISILVVALLALLLTLWVLVPIGRKHEPIVTYQLPSREKLDEPRKRPTSLQRQPSAPASSMARVITSSSMAPVAIPVADVEVPSVSLDFGSGDDFGEGGFGGGIGAGGGAGGGFGSSQPIAGALRGRLYDFKQDPAKQANRDYLDGDQRTNYVGNVVRLHKRDFSSSTLKEFFRAPHELSLTHLAIPFGPASDGPSHFGAEKDMQPSGWVAHYSGNLVVPEDGRYRFVGMGDDYLCVMIDGKVRLVACWPDIQKRIADRWDPDRDSGKWSSPLGDQKLVVGDWVRMRRGQEVRMDLGIGERPGGMLGFILLVEKQGEDYRRTADGRPILPLFTTAPFTPEAKADLAAKFHGFELEWEKVPVFPAR